jgi:heme oxygenase
LFENGNIVLVELKEEQAKEIKLKIINQSYFPDIENIEKLSKNNNKFYAKSNLDDIEKIPFYGNKQMNKKMDKNENRFSISIY